MKKLSLLVAILFLSGCAATGVDYRPELITPLKAGKAQIVVYKPAMMIGNNGTPLLFNNNKICQLEQNRFAVFNLAPSSLSIAMDANLAVPAELKLKILASHRYYVRITDNQAKAQSAASFGLLGLLAYNAAKKGTKSASDWYIESIDAQTASQELIGTKLSLSCK